MSVHLEGKNILENLCRAIIALYVMCAMAFECTPNTVRYSTLAVYTVFLIGVFYIVVKRTLRMNGYVYAMYFMFFYIFLRSFARGAATGVGQEISYDYLTCVVLCYIVYYITYHYPKTIKPLFWAVIIGALILAYRIVQVYGGISAMLNYASLEGQHRVGGDIINENTLGLYMSNALLCCILILFMAKKHKFLYVLVLIPCSVVFISMSLMSGSKKAILFLIAGICIQLWFFTKGMQFKKKLIMYVSIVLAVVGIFYAIKTLPYFATISMRFETLISELTEGSGGSKSDVERIEFIKVGFEAFLQKPLLGNGTGHSYILFGTYSHNNFVEILMNYGIIGFCAYYIPYIALLIGLLKASRKGDRYAAFFLTFTVLQIGLGIAWVNYYERVIQVLAAAAWGYIEHVRDRGTII